MDIRYNDGYFRSVKTYVVSYKNKERRERMNERAALLNLGNFIYTPEVHTSDERLKDCVEDKRTWSIMLQHLDSVSLFMKTGDQHCIICEDDILISRKLRDDLPQLINVFTLLDLDILLLGYLLPFPISGDNPYFPVIAEQGRYTFRRYPDDIWGAQMYLINRRYGQHLLDKFNIDYGMKGALPYNPDFIITKHGHRMLIYPMLAVEEGDNAGGQGQTDFHKRCHIVNYNREEHF